MLTLWRQRRESGRKLVLSAGPQFRTQVLHPKMWNYPPHQESRWESKWPHVFLENIFRLEFWAEIETGSAECFGARAVYNSHLAQVLSAMQLILKCPVVSDPGPSTDRHLRNKRNSYQSSWPHPWRAQELPGKRAIAMRPWMLRMHQKRASISPGGEVSMAKGRM